MMNLSPSTYYYKTKKSRKDREKEDANIADKIEYLQVNYSCWGYRTITAQLNAHYEININKKKVLRIMRKYNLFKKQKKKFCITTDSNHNYQIYPNLIKGMELTGINQLWVSDITYIRIETGFVFLACILDVFSRVIVGYAISKNINHKLTSAALQYALSKRKPEPGLIHHSDRGVQYACSDYIKLLKEYGGIKISMSARGNPYHNAFAESFFKTLKQEEVYMYVGI
jgi:putative transposase